LYVSAQHAQTITGSLLRLAGYLFVLFIISVVQGVLPAAQPDQLAALLDASGPFRDAYLAACLGRMQDAVGAACCFGTAEHWLFVAALILTALYAVSGCPARAGCAACCAA
jgi:hypothetical protein